MADVPDELVEEFEAALDDEAQAWLEAITEDLEEHGDA